MYELHAVNVWLMFPCKGHVTIAHGRRKLEMRTSGKENTPKPKAAQ